MRFFTCCILLSGFALASCGDDDAPPIENIEEEITRVTARFTNVNDNSDVVTAVWFDADGEGSGAPLIDDIILSPQTSYELELELENTLEDPAEDISEEVREEDDEHMFFFEFTDNLFTDPDGDGNVDNRDDPVNYLDFDAGSLPLGLETSWDTGDLTRGTLRIVLKHQPDIKSATSTVADGETDMDITFEVIIDE